MVDSFRVVLGALRIALGWSFVWAFLDKLFGLGFDTEAGASWLAGTSPTTGFLKFATKGPFAEFYQNLAGSALVDWLFMLGLLLIGVALMAGIMVRLAGIFGALFMMLLYTAGFVPPEHNPIIDEHIIYALLLISFALSGRECCWLSTHNWWMKTKLVQQYPWLT